MDETVKKLNNQGAPTFLVKILFRQNSSIQGELTWVEENKTICFRSFMEIVSLIQEAIEKTGTLKKDCQIRYWDSEDIVKTLSNSCS